MRQSIKELRHKTEHIEGVACHTHAGVYPEAACNNALKSVNPNSLWLKRLVVEDPD